MKRLKIQELKIKSFITTVNSKQLMGGKNLTKQGGADALLTPTPTTWPDTPTIPTTQDKEGDITVDDVML